MSETYRELKKSESDALGLPRRAPIDEDEIVWYSNGTVSVGFAERIPPELRAPLPVDKE